MNVRPRILWRNLGDPCKSRGFRKVGSFLRRLQNWSSEETRWIQSSGTCWCFQRQLGRWLTAAKGQRLWHLWLNVMHIYWWSSLAVCSQFEIIFLVTLTVEKCPAFNSLKAKIAWLESRSKLQSSRTQLRIKTVVGKKLGGSTSIPKITRLCRGKHTHVSTDSEGHRKYDAESGTSGSYSLPAFIPFPSWL